LAARSLLPEPARLTAHVLLDALVRRDLPTRRASRRSNAAGKTQVPEVRQRFRGLTLFVATESERRALVRACDLDQRVIPFEVEISDQPRRQRS
jgi:hypothetical protein